MSRARDVVFLERRVYRHRRMIDAAKMLPILACVLFLFPALIIDRAPGEEPSTAVRLVYFFFVWLSLIMVAATTARALRRAGSGEPASDMSQPQDGAPD